MSLKAPGARKKPREEPKDTRFQERNRIAVGVVLAAGGGFLAAMYLGAFSGSEMKNVPPWLSALTSVFAMLISAVAVLLVAKTLQATRETLDATREMANDQKRIGQAQIRPYLLKDSFEPEHLAETIVYRIKLRNFGNTPAINIKAIFHLESFNIEVDEYSRDPQLVLMAETSKSFFHAVIAPQTEQVFKNNYRVLDIQRAEFTRLTVSWQYWDHDRKLDYVDEEVFSI